MQQNVYLLLLRLFITGHTQHGHAMFWTRFGNIMLFFDVHWNII